MLAGSTPTNTGRPRKKISIEAADQDQRPALSVEVLEDTRRLLSGHLDPALGRGAPGAGLFAQDDRQQDEDLVEAQAHRRGRDAELVSLARGELDGLSQPVPEPSILLSEVFVLLDQFGVGRPSGIARPRRRPGPSGHGRRRSVGYSRRPGLDG